MDVLVITDIPRMIELFEQLGSHHAGLTVVNEIHRGIEELERHKPAVVVIQNHLAGLSADILHKHLKSRLGGRKVRFALISSSAALDVDVSAQFEVILDPALREEQFEEIAGSLFKPAVKAKRREEPAAPLNEQPPTLHDTLLPELQQQTSEPEQPAIPAALLSPVSAPAPADIPAVQEPDPITYALPRRPGLSIISDFSKQLDAKADDDPQQPDRFSYRDREYDIRDFHHQPHLITDVDQPRPWFRRTGVILAAITVVAVVGVSLFQHRASQTAEEKKNSGPEAKALPATPAVVPPVVPAAPVVKAAPVAPAAQQFASHGLGRPRTLPGFIPKEGHDPAYANEHPGWDHYRGQTVEYRVFREKDATIKAIQVLDRSGAGIQESFYTSMLKELAGATAMRPVSSEIKEGYEIRRGELAGLQLVQYRDAQGGRIRGFVVTWP